MVKIVTCQECGNRMTQEWKEYSLCPECGGPVDSIDIDMGFAERTPRILMVSGAAFCLFAVCYLLFKLISDDIGQSDGTTTMVFFLVGIGFFAASLLVRMQVSNKAKENATSKDTYRKQRMVKNDPGEGQKVVRSGKVETPPRRTATKVPVRDK